LAGVSVFHGLDAEPKINTYDGRGMVLPVFGPLAIEGLPPVSAWFRSWIISPPLSYDLGNLVPGAADESKPRRRFNGWNVINLKDEWSGQNQCRMAWTWVEVTEVMDLELRVGGDGPLRVWFDDQEVITDYRVVTDLSTGRTATRRKVQPGRHSVCVAMNNRGGEAYGFFFRIGRLDAPAGSVPVALPTEVWD
jgi:hypothetical protein